MGRTDDIEQPSAASVVRLLSKANPTRGELLRMVVWFSVPAILAEVSNTAMGYIDTAMVGSLGAAASAAVGLVASSTWLLNGLTTGAATGFTVQIAQLVGAGREADARNVLRQALLVLLAFSAALALVGALVSGPLPAWLGGEPEVLADASGYFLVYALALPAVQVNRLCVGALQCSGNMRTPSALNVLMCLLDVVFNFFLIFPSRDIRLGSFTLFMPGAGLGVEGAALGTVLAETIAAGLLLWFLLTRSPQLRLTKEHGRFRPTAATLRKALHIGLPMGIEHAVICGAQIMTTVIVAPLGIFAIAANSFAITAESLCYMPGYGIADAATTLVGQSMGAGRRDLTRRFAYITVFMGMLIMGVMGVIMYVAAPQIIGVMTPVDEIRELGVMALRIEAFAEPMFAAAIVAYGVFVGAASTLIPCLMNFFSIWAVRLSLAALLAPTLGLKGVWIAMCVELCFRGVIFLIRLFRGKWLKTIR